MSGLEHADLDRRFGGLRRLYGPQGYERLRQARFAVVGVGGVGSWAVEALARSGVAHLTLVDLDHVSPSNINRQIHAQDATLGQAKAEAMRERIAGFHPGCVVDVIDDFVTPDNWPALLHSVSGREGLPSAVIDACDQVKAKVAMAQWALDNPVGFITVGAAGGKRL